MAYRNYTQTKDDPFGNLGSEQNNLNATAMQGLMSNRNPFLGITRGMAMGQAAYEQKRQNDINELRRHDWEQNREAKVTAAHYLAPIQSNMQRAIDMGKSPSEYLMAQMKAIQSDPNFMNMTPEQQNAVMGNMRSFARTHLENLINTGRGDEARRLGDYLGTPYDTARTYALSGDAKGLVDYGIRTGRLKVDPNDSNMLIMSNGERVPRYQLERNIINAGFNERGYLGLSGDKTQSTTTTTPTTTQTTPATTQTTPATTQTTPATTPSQQVQQLTDNDLYYSSDVYPEDRPGYTYGVVDDKGSYAFGKKIELPAQFRDLRAEGKLTSKLNEMLSDLENAARQYNRTIDYADPMGSINVFGEQLIDRTYPMTWQDIKQQSLNSKYNDFVKALQEAGIVTTARQQVPQYAPQYYNWW